ncbi:MAG: O-methyltransferase [Bryobacteraceae bacterium]
MKQKLPAGVLLLSGFALLVSGGVFGWNLYRFFGKEPVSAAALGKTPAESRILATLEEMRRDGKIQFGVPESDGRRLRLLAEALGAVNAVEIGTSTGYSGLWLSLGLHRTGGRLTTFEMDARRAAIARENFRRAGVDKLVTVVEGDAHENLARLEAPVDLVFLDADKEGYVDYLNRLLPLVRPGGLILAHNARLAPDYMRRVTTDPELDTLLLTQGSGLCVTLKKR